MIPIFIGLRIALQHIQAPLDPLLVDLELSDIPSKHQTQRPRPFLFAFVLAGLKASFFGLE